MNGLWAALEEFVPFYEANLRSSLFSGFMTLTGFLFTLHTFLLVTLHRDIYGNADYQKWVVNTGRRYNPNLKPIRPLRNVGRVLFATLVSSFVTALSQLTFGLSRRPLPILLCVSLAGLTIILFCVTLWVFRKVINDWLEFVENQAESRKTSDERPNEE